MDILLQLIISGMLVGVIYGLVALGFVLIYKASGVFNVAQGEMLMLFAYLIYFFLVQLKFAFPIAIVMTLLSAVIFGIAIERFPMRPLVGQPIFSIVIVTIGIMLMIRAVVVLGWGWGGSLNYPHNIIPIKPVRLGGISISQVHLWAFVASILVLIAFALFFRFTKTGLRMRAVGEEHRLSQSMGININTVVRVVWVISAILSALGGFFLGSMQGLSLNLSYIGLSAIPAALVGGFESIPGAILGGLILGICESLVGGLLPGIGLRVITPYLVVMLVLMIRPYGLFGLKEIRRV